MRLEFPVSAWGPPSGHKHEDLPREPFLTDVVLTDGEVYDNLGLETAWKRYKTILVSNGGGKMQPEEDRRAIGRGMRCASTTSSTTRCAACECGR
jgi:hypothetical protein